MAAVPIKVPGFGESITEVTLARWLKPDGAIVKRDENIYEVESEKASQVIASTTAGKLKIEVPEGQVVNVGAAIGSVDDAVAASAEAAAPAPAPAPSANPAPTTNGGQAASTTLAPSVRRLVAESNVDPAGIEGTGRGGRLTKGDVLNHLSTTPAVPAATLPATVATTSAPTPTPAPSTNGQRETRKRMSSLRQTIASRLVEAQHTAAILTTFNEVDMSRIMELRTKYKEPFQKKHGVALGFMSFFARATVEAVKAFPAVNGRIDGQDVVHHNYVNIGVAVSTERGLMVPVLRDVDKMNFADVEKGIAAYAVKAREGTISVGDLQGGTFTITNGGVFGSLLSTPILNPPQSGILGMHAIQKRPVAVGDEVVIRPMMYLALSYDHRIVDGREAVSFLVRIKECIENPERLMLEV
jgi:2-oxoglutarate dehydrogenase E2 component (dihydrolipoamide succinyltransferase)